MNQLVAGGLLVLGVLFIVALVFIIRSEPAAKKSASVPPPVPTEQEEPKIHSTIAESSSTVETQSTLNEAAGDASSVAENRAMSEWYPLANGQFYELVNELRSMRDQTQELEHRLSALIDMAQRVEQTQNGHFPIEEQASSDTQANA